MSRQLYELLGMVNESEIREGDVVVYKDLRSKVWSLLRPANPQPVNPWVKGSDRLPTKEDAIETFTTARVVEIWLANAPHRKNFKNVRADDYWRRIDQTPPPVEPTIEEKKAVLLELLFSHLEDGGENNWFVERKIREIRNLQESEGCDE